MHKILILIILLNLTKAEQWSSFITKEEYAKMLYKNPRGISCASCHGKSGEGKIISYYIDKNNKKVMVKTNSIKDISFKNFKKRLLENKKDSIMPKYYLKDEELKMLYYFINKK